MRMYVMYRGLDVEGDVYRNKYGYYDVEYMTVCSGYGEDISDMLRDSVLDDIADKLIEAHRFGGDE